MITVLHRDPSFELCLYQLLNLAIFLKFSIFLAWLLWTWLSGEAEIWSDLSECISLTLEPLVSALWIPAVINDLFTNDDIHYWLHAFYYTFQKCFKSLTCNIYSPEYVFFFLFLFLLKSTLLKQSQDIPQYPDISHLQKDEDNISRFTSSEATFMTKSQSGRKQDLGAILRGERHHSEALPSPPHLSAKYPKSRIL